MMKKLFLLMSVIALNMICAQAQDVIFRSSSDSMQVRVLTVGTTEITYRKWNNQEGPIYSIPVNEIAAIRYANGSYDFFTEATYTQPGSSPSTMLTRVGNTYYYNDAVMNKQATLEWLYTQNCPAAYAQFQYGRNLAVGGWLMMALGLGLDFGGIVMYLASESLRGGARLSMIIGGALEIACIPTIAVGYSKMHQTVNVYNVSCRNIAEVKPYWSLQASNNGLGIAYNF